MKWGQEMRTICSTSKGSNHSGNYMYRVMRKSCFCALGLIIVIYLRQKLNTDNKTNFAYSVTHILLGEENMRIDFNKEHNN